MTSSKKLIAQSKLRDGYCSDFSRVVFVGRLSEEEEHIYKFVLQEQEFIVNNLKDGVNTKEILKEVELHYKNENFELLHSFGHNLGLEIHEEPILSAKYETKLKKNMILTVEPGVYLPGKFGIRIEDTILINKDNCNLLTKSSKNINNMIIL